MFKKMMYLIDAKFTSKIKNIRFGSTSQKFYVWHVSLAGNLIL